MWILAYFLALGLQNLSPTLIVFFRSDTAMEKPLTNQSLFCTTLNPKGSQLPPPSPEQSKLFQDFRDVTLEQKREYCPLRILVRVHKHAADGGQGNSILHLDWAGGGFVC